MDIYIYIYIYIYYIRSICIQQLFCSLRAHQYTSDKKKILKDQSDQTTARVVSIVVYKGKSKETKILKCIKPLLTKRQFDHCILDQALVDSETLYIFFTLLLLIKF